MIGTIVRTSLLNLRRDRSALLLTFVLPIAFFSIFAVIFGTQRREGTPAIHVAVVDQDHSRASEDLVAGLKRESGLKVLTAPVAKNKVTPVPYTAESAEKAVRAGDMPVALIIPKGFGASPMAFGPSDQQHSAIQLLSDSSDPIAPQVVNGLLQKTAMTAMPDVMADQGMKYFDQFAGGLTPQQRSNIDQELQDLRETVKRRDQEQANETRNSAATSRTDSNQFSGVVAVHTRDIVGENKKNPVIAFYAAGIGVMFLLFSASGAGGALLDEAETGTLDRVLSTRVTMLKLLAGKLTYLSLIGLAQLTVMFLWGALAFKLELFSHLGGFFVMAAITAVAASALGLVLASACRTRAQLGAVSTLIILIMSALGGSMFPRFLMPESLQKVGLITFNAWAIDGFNKIFWRDEPITHLWPQVAVLLASAIVFFAVARQLAKKWEKA